MERGDISFLSPSMLPCKHLTISFLRVFPSLLQPKKKVDVLALHWGYLRWRSEQYYLLTHSPLVNRAISMRQVEPRGHAIIRRPLPLLPLCASKQTHNSTSAFLPSPPSFIPFIPSCSLSLSLFQVMNPQYALDGAFLSCVTRHMDEHAPFGDIPRKVAASVRRAVVAVRAVARALHSAADIADEMRKVRDCYVSGY